MPAFDGTGPQGQGPMTGRGMGRCEQAQEMRMQRGCGRARGFGRARGRFTSLAMPQNTQNHISALEDEKRIIEEEITRLKKGL